MHILGSSTDRDNGYRLYMELSEVMRTTFSCRQWTDEPVDDATIYRILDNARFAPNGGNRQGWHVTVVKDRACLLYTSPSPRDRTRSRMPSSA